VEVTHSGYFTRARVWLKVVDGTRGWRCTWSSSPVSISLPTLRSVDPEIAERQSSVPRVGDLWISSSEVSPNHFVRLYVPGVEDLFAEGDRLVRIEHSGCRSRIISWRIWWKKTGGWRFQLQSSDEQRFSTFPSNFEPLSPVQEGTQSKFGV
jgi:hypothetical protein